ncbi:hypothetical protein BT69DRAFT_667497 [Atractiella rhizophila]|nr:hypothetical protein BT69DRAFT_667497 [Atractiella rhizophila]
MPEGISKLHFPRDTCGNLMSLLYLYGPHRLIHVLLLLTLTQWFSRCCVVHFPLRMPSRHTKVEEGLPFTPSSWPSETKFSVAEYLHSQVPPDMCTCFGTFYLRLMHLSCCLLWMTSLPVFPTVPSRARLEVMATYQSVLRFRPSRQLARISRTAR